MARRGLRLVTLALLLAPACSGGGDKASDRADREETPEATPSRGESFELAGTITLVLSLPGQPRPTSSPAAKASPSPSPDETQAAPTERVRRGGGVVVRLRTLSESVVECGYEPNDSVAVYWSEGVFFDPPSLGDATNFPLNLANKQIEAEGSIDGGDDSPCIFVAERVQQAQTASPTATGGATARTTGRPTATPRRTGASPSPTRGATASPARSPSPSPSPTP